MINLEALGDTDFSDSSVFTAIRLFEKKLHIDAPRLEDSELIRFGKAILRLRENVDFLSSQFQSNAKDLDMLWIMKVDAENRGTLSPELCELWHAMQEPYV